ncbi:MAG: hypothetical protein GVY11_04360 [Gammaproteobacteria bacterium]|jgi:murein tripeptide amidase MpaA|nr:hypothetical protein [Gammaproteobacteria bacterium]
MRKTVRILAAVGLFVSSLAIQAQESEIIRVLDVPQTRYQELAEMADFWGVDSKTGAVTMAVDRRQRNAIESLGFKTEIDSKRSADLAYARSFDPEAWQRAGAGGIPGFPCYRTVDETKNDLSAMAAQRPDLARWEPIGESWREANGEPGGDNLYVLILSNQNSPHEQPPFVLMAAQHARELTTAETATRFAEWLFDNYDTNATARWLLDHREIHIVAQQNPDGRREVEGGIGMWRKNSNLDACPGGSWTGVDLNRNSDFFFAGPNGDAAECSQQHRGASRSSEPETQAVQSYLDTVFEVHRLGDPDDLPTSPAPDDAEGLFISLHSYSELILFPWEGAGSGSSNNAPNHNQLAWLGRKFGYFTGYQVGRDILYPAGGTMTDYAHGKFGVAAYTYEIGTSFQQSCSSFEQDILPDLMNSLIYAAKSASRPYLAPSGPDTLQAQAIWNSQAGLLRLTGTADGERFARGGAAEAPAEDPVFNIAEIRASFDLPPDQATSTFTINPESGAPVSAFETSIDPAQAIDLPRLLFFQATDTQGNVGVPEAVWIAEQRAAVTPSSLSASLAQGESLQRQVTISNVGSEDLNWSIDADLPAALRDGHDPALDETLDLSDFVLPGGGTAGDTVDGGIESRGEVVGFSFEGTASGLTGNNTYASDMAMTVTAPDDSSYTVGGFQSGNPEWDFQGSSSEDDGTYSSTHIDPEIFGAGGTDDEGAWQFDFEHTYDDTMEWTDVSVTLHKQEPPECVDPAGVAWLTLDQGGGTIAPGNENDVDITIDASNLAQGQHQALLCITTDDPVAELVVVDVSVEVTEDLQRVFEDRFEGTAAR